VVKNEFWCFCAYFQTTRIKTLKRYFLMYGVVKNVFWCFCAYFQITRNVGSKMMLFNVCCGNVRVLMHLRILPDHQNQVLKKIFFNVFVAFSHTFRPPETWTQKWCYLMSEVVIYVFWCICAYFQTTRIKFFKKIFFNVWSG
jgi:hypothetical protein